MSRYHDLRRYYRRSHQERAAMVNDEMRGALAQARGALADLSAVAPAEIERVFGARSTELLEIAVDAAASLQQLVDTLDRRNVVDDDGMRDLRHDLRGPIGTLRNAALMIRRRSTAPEDMLARRIAAVLAAADDMIDVLEALTEEDERDQ